MKKYSTYFMISLLSSAFISSSGFAQSSNPFSNEGAVKVPNKEEAVQQKLKVSGKACEKALKKYRLDGADYIPGVDVRGKKVKSANVDGQDYQFDFPKEIEFDLTLNVFQAAGLANFADLFPDSNINLGKIKYNLTSGSLTHNGKKLSEDQEQAFVKACQVYADFKSKN